MQRHWTSRKKYRHLGAFKNIYIYNEKGSEKEDQRTGCSVKTKRSMTMPEPLYCAIIILIPGLFDPTLLSSQK